MIPEDFKADGVYVVHCGQSERKGREKTTVIQVEGGGSMVSLLGYGEVWRIAQFIERFQPRSARLINLKEILNPEESPLYCAAKFGYARAASVNEVRFYLDQFSKAGFYPEDL